jgi:hypothetical protein
LVTALLGKDKMEGWRSIIVAIVISLRKLLELGVRVVVGFYESAVAQRGRGQRGMES